MPNEQPEERRSVNDSWWWSPALMIVVGLGVIGYQSTPILAGEAIVLNWVMVAVGLAVAFYGVTQLLKARAEHEARQGRSPATGTHDDAG